MAALETLMARINKKYGAGTLVRGDELLYHEIPRATTGSLAFDLMLGGGWPLNKWNEIIGQECLCPGTKILCRDLMWRNIEDLSVGDEIIGFDEEHRGLGKGRTSCYRPATVTALGRKTLPVYAITTSHGTTYSSSGHSWLVHRNTPRGEGKRSVQRHWVKTEDINVGNRIASIGTPWTTDTSWEAGYVAGFYDGEGSVGSLGDRLGARISCNQAVGPTCDRVLEYLDKLGFETHVSPATKPKDKPHWKSQKSWIFKGRYQDMRFLGSIRPERLLEKSDLLWEDRSTKAKYNSTVPVLSIEYVGEREVVTIGTSTKTLIADGLLSHNSNGKTAMVLKTVAANQALDPDWHCLWIASEDFVADWAVKLGVDLSRVTVAEVNIMEQAFQIVIDALDERAVDCIVIDSYPALVPGAEDDKLMDELTMGAGAKIMAQFMRKSGKSIKRNLVREDRPVLGIIINQWRDRIGVMHGDPRTTPGGKAKNFSFFTRVEVTRSDWIAAANKAKVGIVIKATTIKNKTYPQRKTATVDFYFDDNVTFSAGDYDSLREIVTIAIAYEIIRQGGAWYHFEDEKYHGFDAVLQAMREEPALAGKVDAEVRRVVLHELEDSIDG